MPHSTTHYYKDQLSIAFILIILESHQLKGTSDKSTMQFKEIV